MRRFAVNLVALMICAAALNARAGPSIIWSGIRDVDSGYLELDINQDSMIDFLFSFTSPDTFSVAAQGENQTTGPLDYGTTIDSSFPSNNWVSGTQTMSQWIKLFDDTIVSFGPWAGISNGYMGLSFGVDSETYYGWARITSEYNSPYVEIHEWAYEADPGVGITAGAVPEPSAVVLLGLGGIGVVLSRMRVKSKIKSN